MLKRQIVAAIVSIVALSFLTSTALGSQISFAWMDKPERVDSIRTTEEQNGSYIDLIDLAKHLKIPYVVSKHKERLRFDLPGGRMIFTVGLPFVMVEGQMRQMPVPLLPPGNGILAPVEQLIEFLAEYYPGDLFYNPHKQRILASQPGSDLLGVRFAIENGVTRAMVTANRQLVCETELLDNAGITLIFLDGTIDVERFSIGETLGAITSVHIKDSPEGARITFIADSGMAFDRFDIMDDPPLYIATFTSDERQKTDESITMRLEEERNQWEFDIVVIDPGHGGKDPGAIGPTRVYEKKVVLDVGLRLRDALRKKGVKVVMTRKKDVFIPLAKRTKIANSSGGKLFISLHCNSCPDRRARGVETYFLSPTKTERAMQVALKENSVIKYEESQDQYQDLTEENFILLSMAQANFIKESQDLAVVMQNRVSAGTGLKNRGVDQASFYVLIGASMPSVLFEMAFLSNKKEEQKLKDKRFRQKLADSICSAVMEFLE